MNGKFYGVSVGPGDPELITLKAINTIKKSDVIAFPGREASNATAYNIAVQILPELSDKILLPVEMPMSTDKDIIAAAHSTAATQIEEHLSNGKDVMFLVLGDVTIYSTYMYLQEIISSHGYTTEIVSGVTSFCAVAARTGISLCEWDEELVVIPSRHHVPDKFEDGKNYVLMKAGSMLDVIRKKIKESDRDAVCIENCGMVDEKVYIGVDNIPSKAGYYSIVIVK